MSQTMFRQIKEHAKSLKGRCLSKEYQGTQGKYDWICNKKHKFTARWTVVYYKERWCSICRRSEKLEGIYQESRKIIEDKEGRLITKSIEYVMDKLEIRCKNKHKFVYQYRDLIKGKWCKSCRKLVGQEEKQKLLKAIVHSPDGMKPLMEYSNYRKYIDDYYTRSKKLDRKFSYQLLSERCGFSTNSYIIDILKGKKNLGWGNTVKVGKAMGLGFRETRYFTTLVCYNDSKTDLQKDFYLRCLKQLNRYFVK